MKVFQQGEIEEALEYAKAGGQALHLHRFIGDRRTAPKCFVQAVDRGENIAHLFDLNTDRLNATAKRLGVKVLFIDKAGTDRQHIDLCGGPLRGAVCMAQDFADAQAKAAQAKLTQPGGNGGRGLFDGLDSEGQQVRGVEQAGGGSQGN